MCNLTISTTVLAFLPLDFEEPVWLLLLFLIVPTFLMARRSIGGMSRGKATTVFAFRLIVIVLLATALSHPMWEQRGEGVTTTLIVDVSPSIPNPLKASAEDFLRAASQENRERDDRLAVITVSDEAYIVAMPDPNSEVNTGQYPGDLTATNLAAAVRLGLAIGPADTANRILLASDGNETVDSVLAAAEVARASKVPVDVLLLNYEHENEVIFDHIVMPAQARRGQRIYAKLVLHSQKETPGILTVRLNGEPIDLSDGPGNGMQITLPAGGEVYQIPLGLEQAKAYRLDALFEPLNPEDDVIQQNNSAVGVTFVSGEGKVLVLDDGDTESQYLVRALIESDIEVEVIDPEQLLGGLVFLSDYDAVVLANVPRHVFTDEQDRMLHAYVHDLGGGLVMLGGPNSFGAGGWISSELSKALPVKLDPPQTRQMPRGALALIMHSCEMPQGNFWGQKVAQAAINALSRLDYVGIVEYNWNPGVQNVQGCSWAHEMQPVGDKSAALAATKTMVVGDMPAFGPSMQLAHQGLMGVNAGQRHAIIISDGDPSPPTRALMDQYVAAKVTVTTVMVGGHGTAMDRNQMQAIATKTGGNFYNVTNPKNLPQIFIKEAQLVSRSLIQEGDVYYPQVVSRLPGPIEGFSAVPQVDGYILTAEREGLQQTPIVVGTEEGPDPIYAYWNFGLGKSIAYTSDITGRWGSAWATWSDFKVFWEQSIRWVMRPSTPSNMIVNTRMEGERAIVEIEALEADASFLNFLRTQAVVIAPDNRAEPLSLQQIGPGRYRGEFRVEDAGAYLVNVNYRSGQGDDMQAGNLQAAVAVPYSREFRAVKHNRALLQDLADSTGGRMIEAADPMLADLFYRGGLEIPKSAKHIWDLLAILAAILFIFDVAARRLSIEPKVMAALFGKAMGKRADVSTATVAAWKRSREQVAHRQSVRAAVKSQEKAADKKVRFEATEEDLAKAIDVGGEQVADISRPASSPKRAETQDEEEDEGGYTSRLLQAKRRARGEEEEGEGGHGG